MYLYPTLVSSMNVGLMQVLTYPGLVRQETLMYTYMQTIQNLYSLYNSIHTINNAPSITYATSRIKVCIITKNPPKSMKTRCLFCIAGCTGRRSWREPSLFQFRLQSFQLCCQCRLYDPVQCLSLKETHVKVNYKIYIMLQSGSVHYWPNNESLGKL